MSNHADRFDLQEYIAIVKSAYQCHQWEIIEAVGPVWEEYVAYRKSQPEYRYQAKTLEPAHRAYGALIDTVMEHARMASFLRQHAETQPEHEFTRLDKETRENPKVIEAFGPLRACLARPEYRSLSPLDRWVKVMEDLRA